jgi:hypothetical protein
VRRRTLFRSLLAATATIPIPRLRAWAQGAAFPGTQDDTLRELAATVLPESLGREGTDQVARQFTAWIRGYRPGAEMSSGYGTPRLRYKGPSPAPLFEAQLKELAAGALATGDLATRREQLARELQRAGVADLATVPRGDHVVADLMSFWFTSSAAHDLAYEAAIGKDRCRTIASSAQVPAPLVRR